jgi:hypothetical protein
MFIILFCSHKFHKTESYIIFEMLKKKIWANFQRILEVFTQKIFTKLSKIWVRDPDPRSGIRDPEKTYSGSRIQGSKKKKGRNQSAVLILVNFIFLVVSMADRSLIEISSCFFQLVLEFVQQVLSNSEHYKSTRYFHKPKELPSKLLILSYFWIKKIVCQNFLTHQVPRNFFSNFSTIFGYSTP